MFAAIGVTPNASHALTGTARLQVGVSIGLHTLLKRAALFERSTLTDFVIDAVQTAARSTVEGADVLDLSAVDQAASAQTLLAKPKPSAALKRAFAKRNKLLAQPLAKA